MEIARSALQQLAKTVTVLSAGEFLMALLIGTIGVVLFMLVTGREGFESHGGWLCIVTVAGTVAVAASAVAIATLAAVVRRWGVEGAQPKASLEPVQGGILPRSEVEHLSERLRALARDLEVEAHNVAAASEEHKVTPP